MPADIVFLLIPVCTSYDYSKLTNLLGSIFLATFDGRYPANTVVRKTIMRMVTRIIKGILKCISHPKEILLTTWIRIMLIRDPRSVPRIIPEIPMIPAESMSVCCICFQLPPKYRTMLISLLRSITSDRSAVITPIRDTMIEMNSIA